MRSERETDLYRYLIKLGHSPGNVVYEPAFKAATGAVVFRPDFALLDPRSRTPIAAVELKEVPDKAKFDQALDRVCVYAAAVGIPTSRAFVARPYGDGFEFFHRDQDGAVKQVSPSFLEYAALVPAAVAEKKTELVNSKKRVTDWFFWVCVGLALAALGLAVADFIADRHGIHILSSERLGLLAAAAGLAILPFLQKFKALGVEIERIERRADG